jgi:hypothetical protein
MLMTMANTDCEESSGVRDMITLSIIILEMFINLINEQCQAKCNYMYVCLVGMESDFCTFLVISRQ